MQKTQKKTKKKQKKTPRLYRRHVMQQEYGQIEQIHVLSICGEYM